MSNANTGNLTLTDCTLSGNSAATYGGGVFENYKAQLSLTGCTVSGNSATYGGGLYANSYPESYNTVLTDTIVAGNTNPSGASDVGGNVSGSYNLIGTGGSGGLANGVDGNIVGVANPLLSALGNNGGPTQTMALLAGSPALGAGVIADYPGTSTPITTDQRGEPLDTPNPDIGAFQTQNSTLTSLSFSGISGQSITYGTSSVTVSGTLSNGSQAPVGETVAVTLDGNEQPATIGSGGAFSTTFNDDDLIVSSSPDTITYAYTSDGTFASASTTSTLTVNPATLTITAKPETKVYGHDDPALAYTASGFQFHDTAASVLTGEQARAQAGTLAGEQAGGFAISQGTLAANSNYTISYTGSTLTITPAHFRHRQCPDQGLRHRRSRPDRHGNRICRYHGRRSDHRRHGRDGAFGPAFADTRRDGIRRPVCDHPGHARGERLHDQLHRQYADHHPGDLTVTANPQTKVYGTADPALTVSQRACRRHGRRRGDRRHRRDGAHGPLARTSGESWPASGRHYAITQGTLAANSNYTLSFTASRSTITPATLNVTANSQSKVYGTADPALTDTPAGLVDPTVDGVTIDDTAATALTDQLARAPGETVSGGPYAITQGTLAADSNYTLSFTGGTLAITPATLTITANPETKVFGSADPTLAYTAAGFQFDDTAATVLSGHLSARGRPDGNRRSLRDHAGHARGRRQLHDPVHRQHADNRPGDARGDRERPGRDLHRRSDRGRRHRDRLRRHGDPDPGRRDADPDLFCRFGHLRHESGLHGPFRRRDLYRRGQLPR